LLIFFIAHDLTYRGLCASCGVDTEVVMNQLRKHNNATQYSHADQLSLNLDWIVPGFCGLQANSSHIVQQIFKQDYQSMLQNGKLRLVLDMDETLLHSVKTPIDGPQSLNSIPYDSQSWFSFSLSQNSAFTVFLRPQLGEFLTRVSKHYEIYIYTNGTDGYAKTIYHHLQRIFPSCNIQAIFTKSVHARTTGKKQLHKMLCKRSMSLIVDDRPDVWCDNDSENIIPISPFKCNINDYMNPNSSIYLDQELPLLGEYLVKLHERYIKALKLKNKVDVRQVLKQFSREEMEDDYYDSDMEDDDQDMNDNDESEEEEEEEDNEEEDNKYEDDD
jgi:TFIIF-interacting CTD phosphatase-like protein